MKIKRRKAQKLCRDLPGHSLPATETPHAAAGTPTALLQCLQTEDTHPPGVSPEQTGNSSFVSYLRLTLLHLLFHLTHSLVNKSIVFPKKETDFYDFTGSK